MGNINPGHVPHPSFFAATAPDRPALIMADTGDRVTYAELAGRAAQAARLYNALGIAAGDTIAILLENHVRYPELLWGAKDSGLRYVAISSHLNAEEAAFIIADSDARMFITSSKMENVSREVLGLLTRPIPALMIDGATPPFLPYETLLSEQPATRMEGRRRGASMLYSSGTTGKPKGVRTQLTACSPEEPPQRFAITVPLYGFDQDSVFLNPGPFYHAAPQRFMMTIHRCGGTAIGFQRFDARTTLDAIGRYRATHGFFVPTMFSRMLALDAPLRAAADVSSMRHAIHAAAPCPAEVKRAMIAWWGPVIDELYSGTEAIGHTFIGSEEWLAHPGSVGRPAPGCEIRIVDEANRPLPTGEPGRILMANGLDVAYHGIAATSALKDAEGFASMGDVGYVDSEGYLYLTDRESHMIIVGGVNIYPQEAEAILALHPDVADVAVIGVPHADMGEEVKAVVATARPPENPEALAEDILAFCRARLSVAKCPRTIDFVTSLPRNDMGKLLKRVVREPYWAAQGRSI